MDSLKLYLNGKVVFRRDGDEYGGWGNVASCYEIGEVPGAAYKYKLYMVPDDDMTTLGSEQFIPAWGATMEQHKAHG